tara:strand:+ start:797 stop:5593 length:4797 start_codon:yes stop_codon:yes gene_type:complete
MANFNLDRIRFKWRSDWVGTTVYTKDDIVYFKGKAYVCLIGHTADATTLITDLSAASPKWEKMLDGMVWRGIWLTSTYFTVGDIVKYDGYVYRCTTTHTSTNLVNVGISNDISNWEILAAGYNWVGTWTNAFYYELGDVVSYGGIVYICSTKHTSASTYALGLEADQASWTEVTKSDDWLADWAVSTRYTVNDVVKYNGIVYRCIIGHTSNASDDASNGLEVDQGKWQTVLDGIEYKGTWTTGTRYRKNDLVKYGETIWKCLVHHTANASFRADELSSYWQIWLPGFGYELLWNSATEYQVGDLVLYGGYVYTCLQNNLNSVPSINGKLQDTGNWEVTKEGYKHKGEYDNATQYYTGDLVRNGGYLYICITDSNGEYPDTSAKWQILVPGHRWKSDWVDNTQYFIGDIVTYDGSAYYCIARHAGSESDNRPDLDIANEHENYWQLLLAGIDGNVLTTDGDLRVRDSSQTTRLAIGSPGATLKEVSGDSVWSTYGSVSKVYYVAPTGVDSATTGTTIASPFLTIKYACDYINSDWANRAPATIFVTAGEYKEILPIKIPKETTIVGDELRSVTVMPAASYETSDMFYTSNGGGLRNCTLQGLTGTLGTQNAYGTKRPSAGAFISLDPGTGPGDTSVHITSKSSYVQNVTTFGTGCVGIKIDGALHNAGNKSIVANDFTQIISDGIGVWATNNGRTEIVSVFTYYNHIGYLSDAGGKIRATNGNNSYGTFGSVAEGFDSTETAITGTVNNRSAEATANALTDNVNMILGLEYKNAGTTYTPAGTTVTFAGQGANAAATYQETRDDGVYEVRLTDPGDSSAAGGNNYQFKINNAQGGNTTSITLAAADTDGTNAKYSGLRIYLREGLGVGQYGYISSYDPASKIAQVSRESDDSAGWDHINPGWPIETLLSTNTRYSLEPRVTFSDHPLSATSVNAPSSDSWEHVIWFPAGNHYVAFTSGPTVLSSHSTDGVTWSTPATRLTSKTVSKVLSDTNGSRILICTSAGVYGFTTAMLSNSNTPSAINPSFTAVDVDGAAIKEGTSNFAYGSNTHQLSYTTNLSSITAVTPTGSSSGGTHAYKRVSYGAGIGNATNGAFVAINEGTAGGHAVSTDLGANWTQYDAGSTGRLPVGYTDIKFGNGRFVAIDPGGVSTLTKTAISFDGITWYEHSIPGATDYLYIEYGGGTFMAIGTGTQIAKSQDGAVWRTTSDDSTDFNATESATWTAQAYSPTLQKWSIISSSNNNWNTVTGWGAKPFARAVVASDKINEFLIYEPGSQYASTPTVTVYDSQATINSTQVARIGDGVLSQPVFSNRGTSYITATATITGDGYADSFQIGKTLNLTGVSLVPGPGDNLKITGIDDVDYKIATIESSSGSAPNYTVQVTISPTLGRAESPIHGTAVTVRQQYSQVRLTGHDFLDIGTGNRTDTDYPNRYVEGYNATNDPKQEQEVREANAGRVFYTSTDQDGNFRVGEQFRVQQNTGIITVQASQFNLTGLNELSLGGIVVGGTQVVINEFSKEPTFIANANNIVPTQKAIGRYLQSRVSDGGANAATTKLVAGQIDFSTNNISTDSGNQINIPVHVDIAEGIDGDYLAHLFFNSRK